MPIKSTDYNGFFREVIPEIYNFFQSYLISCLVQLLRKKFQKMLHFTLNFIFFVSTFSINLSLILQFAREWRVWFER